MPLSEAMRYLGASMEDTALRTQVEAILRSVPDTPRYVYRVFDLTFPEGIPHLAHIALPGESAKKMLSGCEKAVILACTMGLSFDQRLRSLQARNMADALILNACGSALVEQGCDAAETEISHRFPDRFLTDRFSPGYGDLPLSVQKELCEALDTSRRLGITLTDSMLMNPSKSVTAIIGLAATPRMARIRGCAYCSMKETCALRKGGNHCGF